METSYDNMSVLLQFAKFSKGFRISDFEEFIEESIGVENFDFFGRLAYPNQWQIRLTDKKVREDLIRKGRTRIKNRSCWIYPLNQQEIRGIIHWLPNSVTNDQLKEELRRYGEVLFVESGARTVNKRQVETDPRYYGLILPYGTIKEDLPHFLKINGFLCLVVVRGREPACYHCKEVGHRRIECPKYKAKLTSYCSREPNTALPRLRPRGKRHLKTDTEVQAETGGNDVSSTQDKISSDREMTVAESMTESDSSAPKEIENFIEAQQEGATGSTEKELEESYIFPQRDSIDSSAASLSETQLRGIREVIQQEQQKTKKILQQTLKEFEKTVVLAFTKGAVSTHARDQRRIITSEVTTNNLNQEMSNEQLETRRMEIHTTEESAPIEVHEKHSDANPEKETMTPKTLSDLQSISQVEMVASKASEEIHKVLERKPNYPQPTEPTVQSSTSTAGTSSSEFLFSEERKEAISETCESAFGEFEFEEGLKTHEKSPEENVILVTSNEELERQLMDIVTREESKSVEKGEKGSNSNTGMKDTTIPDTLSDLQNLSAVNVDVVETDEKINKNLEEIPNYLQPTESAATHSNLNPNARSFELLFREKTKQDASKPFRDPFKDLQKFIEETKALEKSPEVPALDTGVKIENDKRILLDFLEETEIIAMKEPQRIAKEIEAHLTNQKSGEDTKLREDIRFTEQVLAKTMEECRGKLQRKIKSLKEEVKMVAEQERKEAEQSAIEAESATQTKTIPKFANIQSQPKIISEQDVDKMASVCKENREIVEVESSQKASAPEQSPVQTIETESEPITYAHGDTTIEKTLSVSKEVESNVSKAAREDMEKLHANVKKIFALAQAKTKLDPKMDEILKQVESEVIEEIEKTKNKWKADS